MLKKIVQILTSGNPRHREILINPSDVLYVTPSLSGRVGKSLLKVYGEENYVAVDMDVQEIISHLGLRAIGILHFEQRTSDRLNEAECDVLHHHIKMVEPFGNGFKMHFKDGSTLAVKNIDGL